ncbi:MAG: single-stranded-DNA-specific exonuclease RecJ [Myxococcota bacterium]
MHPSHLSLTGRKWNLHPQHVSVSDSLHPLVARCLSRRIGEKSLSDWMRPSLDHLHDPYAMLGMVDAVARIRDAIRNQQRIRIVTDYDVDGTTSSLILQQTLIRIGGKGLIDYHIPDRFAEGYGFSVDAARKAAADGVALIITADIGVKDHPAVDFAHEAGVDVIVCDHHLPAGESVPENAYAVLCPPQDACTYPNKSLAACGVSLKLAQALLRDHPKYEALLRSMLKVAAIGTVADVVDLSGLENRAIVSLGIEQLRTGRHAPGLQALLDVCGLSNAWISARDLGYKVSPRINAAGRLTGANAVVELFSARSPERAYELARALDDLNDQRKQIQSGLVDACIEQLGTETPDFAVLAGDESEGWHRGVVGIVAARIRDRIHRPTAVIAIMDELARGSVRSITEIHAVRALESASDLLAGFGGHPAAAGFTVPVENIPALRERLCTYVREQARGDLPAPTLELDADCQPRDLNWDTVRALQKLGPHGKGNPTPLLWVRNVRPSALRTLSGDKHVKFRVGALDAIWWNGGKYIDQLNRPLDLAAEIEINRWKGRTTLQLNIEDVAPH